MFLFLKREEEAWIYKTGVGTFEFLLRFQDMALKSPCCKMERPFGEWEGDRISKIPNTILETRYG